jgi:hypothetical protein
MLTASMQAILGERARGLDLDRLTATARASLNERPQTFEELRSALRAAFAAAESWLGARLDTQGKGDLRALVLRWPRLAPRACAMPKRGRTCGVSPIPSKRSGRSCACSGTSADASCSTCRKRPVRPRTPRRRCASCPDYDNVLLAHADRTRVIADAHRSKVSTGNLRTLATFLVDGFVAGVWRIERKRASASLLLEPFAAVSRKTRAELAEEGEALVGFVEPDARTADVRFG